MLLSYKKYVLAIVLAIGGMKTGGVFAQTQKSLTLNEAIELCLQNNKQLKANQVKVDAAESTTREAKEKRLPDAGVSGSYVRLAEPNISGPLGSSETPAINQAAYATMNVSMPLFAGLRTKNGIESAKYLEEAARLDAESNKDAVVQNAIAAYTNLYKAKSNVDLIQENLKQAEQRTADFENMEANGIVARNDLLRIKLQQSNIQLALMDAESNWRMANLNLNLMLGLEENTQLELDSSSFVSITEAKTQESFEQQALSSRHDIEALKLREKSAFKGIKIAKADYFPSIKLTGGYFAAHVPDVITISNAWNGGIGVSYNIGSLWKTGTKINSAKVRLEEVKANQELLNDQVKLEVNNAFETFSLSQKKIQVYADALEQAVENNRITKNKYRNNLVSTIDLLDADIQQLQAEMNYANSKADAVVAYNKLLQVTGSANYTSK